MKPHEDHLMNRPEVEARYGIPQRFLEQAVTKGGGPKLVRIGRLVRYRPRDIEHWIDQQTTSGGGT